MTCSAEEARTALARVLRDGLGMQVDRNRSESAAVSDRPMIIIKENMAEVVEEYLSPRVFVMRDPVDVALVLAVDFQGSRDAVAAHFAAQIDLILVNNPTLDGIVDVAEAEPYTKDMPTLFGIDDLAACHVPVTLEYCSFSRSGG